MKGNGGGVPPWGGEGQGGEEVGYAGNSPTRSPSISPCVTRVFAPITSAPGEFPNGGAATRRFRADELMRYARICRVHNVMKPYLEATLRPAPICQPTWPIPSKTA